MPEPSDRGAAAARLQAALAQIEPADRAARALAEAELDAKTKPRRSLGRLEDLAAQVAGIRRGARGTGLEAALVVAAADHGVAAEGVSAYPQEVTAQMVANLAQGGAAVCVLARQANARVMVVDAGVAGDYDASEVRRLGCAAGTANSARGPAMSEAHALHLIAAGIELAAELAEEGIEIVGLGEMGIGNTTAASALSAALLGVDPRQVTGPGTGLDREGVRRKVAVVERALAVNRSLLGEPVTTLAAVGGYEIALLAGLALGAAARRLVVVVDGFISAAAVLVAARLAPALGGYLVAAHLSPEFGHRLLLDELGLEPVLDLALRLGEGSAAALALPVIRASLAILDEMATFETAGVTDAGR